MSTSSNKPPKKGEDGMGKLGKRKEMVEDRVQEIYVEGRCMKEFRVKVLLVKEVCVRAWRGVKACATQSEGPCCQVPRLPRKSERRCQVV